MNAIVIYHKGCLDGFTAAWCFYDYFRDKPQHNIEYHAGVYQDPPPDVRGKYVFLVDFSYKRPVVEEMIKVAESVILIDHHKTALEDLDGLPGLGMANSSIQNSGCVLAWTFLNNGMRPPAALQLIEDRDLWKFSMFRTKAFNTYLFTQPQTFDRWTELMYSRTDQIAEYVDIGNIIIAARDKDINSIIKSTRRTMVIADMAVPVVNAPFMYASDIGAVLSPNEHFVAIYYDAGDHRNFNLRSDKDYIGAWDVSEIAKLYGGGGHKHAAGFKVSRDHELARI